VKPEHIIQTQILVIEDNPINLELMTYLLNKFGYFTITANDGEEGLILIKTKRPDLIICDINLPKMNGSDIARNIKATKEYKNIPMIAVTADAMVGDRARIIAAGFNGYISKPIDPQTFIQQIEEFLEPSKRNK
jgi:CheY-like chemotaxis protein